MEDIKNSIGCAGLVVIIGLVFIFSNPNLKKKFMRSLEKRPDPVTYTINQTTYDNKTGKHQTIIMFKDSSRLVIESFCVSLIKTLPKDTTHAR